MIRNRTGASARGTPRVPPGGSGGAASIAGFAAGAFLESPDFDDPNNADWVVNAIAAAATDSNNNSLQARLFDDTVQEGIGFDLFIPSEFDQLTLTLVHRPETAPGAATTVAPFLYRRTITDAGAVGAWSAAITLFAGGLAIPTNEFWNYDASVLSYATLGVTPDTIAKFELTRNPASADDGLTGDWTLFAILARFSTS